MIVFIFFFFSNWGTDHKKIPIRTSNNDNDDDGVIDDDDGEEEQHDSESIFLEGERPCSSLCSKIAKKGTVYNWYKYKFVSGI